MKHQELKDAVKTAMKERAEVKLSVLRGLLSAATNEAVAKGKKPDGELTEEELLSVISRGAKQRKDSIEQFEKGGRADLAAKEKEELSILESLLPPQMSPEEIETAVKAKAAEIGVTDLPAQAGKSGANKLMGILMKDLKGRADGTLVKATVDKFFA